jgi:hypothetical protein
MYRMQRIMPLIGATVTGPLGVMHLPRMWLKSVYSAAGLLWEGYFDNYKGFNAQVCDGIGLEPDAWFAFLATMPTYPQAEDYVRAHATKLDAASIAALNEKISSYPRAPEGAAATRARTGITDANVSNSALLINYDDWLTAHEELLAHEGDGIEPLIPMVSSGQVGLAGIPHLPRMWMKALLSSVHALPAEWKTGVVCGFDKRCADTIGLDLVATSAYINNEKPTYLQFEAWVLDHIAAPNAATKAEWVAQFNGMQKAEAQAAAEVIESGATDPSLRGTILLNDMVDWKHMHDHVVAARVTRA